MRRFVVACLLAATAVAAAARAAADPQDLVPYCSGDQTPMDSNCQWSPSQVFTHDTEGGSSLGADPQVGLGTNPDEQPVV